MCAMCQQEPLPHHISNACNKAQHIPLLGLITYGVHAVMHTRITKCDETTALFTNWCAQTAQASPPKLVFLNTATPTGAGNLLPYWSLALVSLVLILVYLRQRQRHHVRTMVRMRTGCVGKAIQQR